MTAPTTGGDGRLGLTMTLHTSTTVVQDPRLVELGINVVRGLAMDAPQQADSGHSGTAMALAPLAHVLWTRVMNYDPRDPGWPDRDRFVLSCGHACILQYAMLHLTGYDLSLEDLRQFRQWGSKTPGHPEVHHTAGIEVTTGPLGQGFANAVGMALAERIVRTHFGREVCDHRTYVIASDGCMMEGISHEAASLAGHLGLGRLLAVYDDNHITIDGPTELTYDDDVVARFEAYGWRVRHLGEMANDVDGLDAAIGEALDQPPDAPDAKPTLLVLRSHIGWPSPNLTDTAKAHGTPFGDEEIRATKEILGLPPDETFWVPDEVRDLLRAADRRGASARTPSGRPASRPGTATAPAGTPRRRGTGCPAGTTTCPRFESGTMLATRHAVNQCIDATVGSCPGLVAGSADLTGNNGVLVKGAEIQARTSPGGTQVHYGIREHGMGGVMNGMAAHHGVLPVGGTFFVFSDYMRPAVRLAALGGAHVIYSWTHDSIGLGEDGPTHQPIEHLASLRAMPGLSLVRPADANETAQAWRLAVEAERAGRPRPHPPEHPGAGRDRRRGGRRSGAGRLRPGRSGGHPRHRARGHGERGPALPGRRDHAGRLRRAGAGGVVPVLGPLRAAGRGLPGAASSRPGCRCSASRRARPSAGTATPTTPSGSTTSARRPRWPSSWRSSASRPSTWWNGPAPCWPATVADPADRRRELSR